jgi:hypothetical protein
MHSLSSHWSDSFNIFCPGLVFNFVNQPILLSLAALEIKGQQGVTNSRRKEEENNNTGEQRLVMEPDKKWRTCPTRKYISSLV